MVRVIGFSQYTALPAIRASIVIRARNEAAYIGRLLRGIAIQDMPRVEVLLVDSGSTDDTRTIARAAGARVVDLAPERFTYGHALNVGCREARAPVCVFVSAHCLPANDRWLTRLLEPLRDPAVAASYGGEQGTRFVSIFVRRDELNSADGALTEEALAFNRQLQSGELPVADAGAWILDHLCKGPPGGDTLPP